MRSVWIVIPGQPFDKGKTRLAPVLDAPSRRRFSRDCLVHVVRTARRVLAARQIVVVSRAAEVLGLARRLGVRGLIESGRGLNTAVTEATRFAARRGAAAVLVLHADLPAIGVRDLGSMVRKTALRSGVVIAPDAADEGSNALGVHPPGKIRYRFGADSFRKHRAEARRARANLLVIREPGLAQDVDTPDNYRQFLAQNK